MNPNNQTDRRNEILGTLIFWTCIVSFIIFCYLNTAPFYR